MPRSTKTFQMSGVNIALHPHSVNRYLDFWKKLFALEHAVKIRGDTYAMLGTITAVDANDPKAGFVGSVFKFTKITRSQTGLICAPQNQQLLKWSRQR